MSQPWCNHLVKLSVSGIPGSRIPENLPTLRYVVLSIISSHSFIQGHAVLIKYSLLFIQPLPTKKKVFEVLKFGDKNYFIKAEVSESIWSMTDDAIAHKTSFIHILPFCLCRHEEIQLVLLQRTAVEDFTIAE